ncbi:hypothetical protein GIB67_035067 [Kingdonia uniflora]|uniref:Uncharacterized protein n=1 Tax=Kingdonia uniflora TaxID=39325 RepID=A0A7J7L1Q9_9MAGN|nr:hypothetical protein GIB67_035067 [Kingdonia uniflora]
MVVSEGESMTEGSTARPSCTVPVGWVGGHDHEAGTSVPRDLRVESQADFVVLGRVPGDLAHEDIISGFEKGVSKSFGPYPSKWRLPGTVADYESPGITIEFLDVVNEREKTRGGSKSIWPDFQILASNQCIVDFRQFDAGLRFPLDDLTKKCLNLFGRAPG